MDVSGESHFNHGRDDENVAVRGNLASQRLRWEALKTRINGLVKGVTASNVKDVAEELLSEDLIWGRGLFCSAILNSSESEPVLAALVAGINSIFPDVGYLLLKRIVNQFKAAFEQKDKPKLLPLVKLFAHLLNQGVVHELVALQFLLFLLQNPTKDSVEVAVLLVQQCGSAVHAYAPTRLDFVFERFQEIVAAGGLDAQNVSLIQDSLAIRTSRFSVSGYSAVPPELDIVELDDQVTHEISLFNEMDPETFLDLFRPNSQAPMNDDECCRKQVDVDEDEDVILKEQENEAMEEDDEFEPARTITAGQNLVTVAVLTSKP